MDIMAGIASFVEEIKDSGKLILVEGKKDRIALEHFGITNIKTLNKKPLFHVIEEVAHDTKDCILLVDLDKEGKHIFGKLNSGLQHHGVRVDSRFREFLFKKTKLRQIEGLVSYVNGLKQ